MLQKKEGALKNYRTVIGHFAKITQIGTKKMKFGAFIFIKLTQRILLERKN